MRDEPRTRTQRGSLRRAPDVSRTVSARMSVEALIDEVTLTPKPGLVDLARPRRASAISTGS